MSASTDIGGPGSAGAGLSADGSTGYEPPVLLPLGNLRDLLAAGGTDLCDLDEVVPGAGVDPVGCV